MKEHLYSTELNWTGNQGVGTSSYTSYARDYILTAFGKPSIPGSSDPQFRGNASRYNPEELLVASLSACHMLWYLHLCAVSGIIVTDYRDRAQGCMVEDEKGSGRFRKVTLYPEVTVKDASMVEKAQELHHKAHEMCFIANSCNFPVLHEPNCFIEKSSIVP